MTRLISGLAGGRRLKVPRAGVRPTGDRAREGLFNSLGSLLDLDGARVLDLYAGSGALGLEALSRGAAEVVFVESGSRVLPVLRANVASIGLPGGRVVAGSVPTVVAGRAPARFDLVLADPPYATPVEEVLGVLQGLVAGGGGACGGGGGGRPPPCWGRRAGAGRSRGNGRHPWPDCAIAATGRRCSG